MQHLQPIAECLTEPRVVRAAGLWTTVLLHKTICTPAGVQNAQSVASDV